jgi:hypothetical protein
LKDATIKGIGGNSSGKAGGVVYFHEVDYFIADEAAKTPRVSLSNPPES